MMASVILHNMIIDDERDSGLEHVVDYHTTSSTTHDDSNSTSGQDLAMFMLRYQAVRN